MWLNNLFAFSFSCGLKKNTHISSTSFSFPHPDRAGGRGRTDQTFCFHFWHSTSPMSNFSTPFYIKIRNSMQHFFTNVEIFAIILHRGSKCNTVFLADAEFSQVFYTETQNMVYKFIFSHDDIVHHYTHNFVTTALPTSQLATHGHYGS